MCFGRIRGNLSPKSSTSGRDCSAVQTVVFATLNVVPLHGNGFWPKERSNVFLRFPFREQSTSHSLLAALQWGIIARNTYTSHPTSQPSLQGTA